MSENKETRNMMTTKATKMIDDLFEGGINLQVGKMQNESGCIWVRIQFVLDTGLMCCVLQACNQSSGGWVRINMTSMVRKELE